MKHSIFIDGEQLLQMMPTGSELAETVGDDEAGRLVRIIADSNRSTVEIMIRTEGFERPLPTTCPNCSKAICKGGVYYCTAHDGQAHPEWFWCAYAEEDD